QCLQEGRSALRAAQEFLDGNVHIPRIAWSVNFGAQPRSGAAVEVTMMRLLKSCGEIRGDSVRPRITIDARVVAGQMSEIGDERGVVRDQKEGGGKRFIGEPHTILAASVMDIGVQGEINEA